eukprot:GILK01011180.1.p1 GENE.GILK01011180.1~~GILK01011180.1.p1  ORF type:complete len:1137 (-),score=223.73 GILK01011180.1:106-3309(-)
MQTDIFAQTSVPDSDNEDEQRDQFVQNEKDVEKKLEFDPSMQTSSSDKAPKLPPISMSAVKKRNKKKANVAAQKSVRQDIFVTERQQDGYQSAAKTSVRSRYFGADARQKFWKLFRDPSIPWGAQIADIHNIQYVDVEEEKDWLATEIEADREFLTFQPSHSPLVSEKERKLFQYSNLKKRQTGSKLGKSSSAPVLPTLRSPVSAKTAQTYSRNGPLTSRGIFVKECQQLGVLPKPVIVRKKAADSGLKLGHYGLLDRSVTALAHTLESMPVPVTSLDLTANGLNDQGCATIVESLMSESVHIQELNLSQNKVGPRAVQALETLLLSNSRLTDLNLSGCKLGDANVDRIFTALHDHRYLARLNVSNCNYGANKLQGAGALGLLLRENRSIQSLDLSWNMIRGKAAMEFLYSLTQNLSLSELNLAYNGFGKGSPAPLTFMAEILPYAYSLRKLDLSHNQITCEGAFVLGQALKANSTLQSLHLDGNPIEVDGLRAILRSINDTSNQLNELHLSDCSSLHNSFKQIFDPLNPEGEYQLDLSIPYHRVIVKQLLDFSVRRNVLGKCFSAVTLNRKPYTFPTAESTADKGWALPESGQLSFSFVMNVGQHSITGHSLSVEPNSQEQYFDHSLWKNERVSGSRMIQLVDIVRNVAKRANKLEQDMLMTALTTDFAFMSLQAVDLIRVVHKDSKLMAAARLLPQILDRSNRWMIMQELDEVERTRVEQLLGVAYHFTPSNATDHYKLDLSNPFERILLLHLLQINQREKILRKQKKLKDCSQKGNGEQFRNEKYQRKDFEITTDWKVPLDGIVEFDYVSSVRPPAGAEPIDVELFEQFCYELESMECEHRMRTLAFRAVSDNLYVSSAQLCKIVTMFTDSSWRVDSFIAGYSLVVDEEELYKVVDCLTAYERQQILHRIGYLYLVNPLRMEGRYENLDLSVHEHRVILQMLIDLAMVEPGENLVDEIYNGREFDMGTSWVKNPPRCGIYSCTYVAAKNAVRMRARRQLCRTYLGWQFDEDAPEVADEKEEAEVQAQVAAELDLKTARSDGSHLSAANSERSASANKSLSLSDD